MFVYELSGSGFENQLQLQSLKLSDFARASSKEFLDIQATIECGFTLKRVCDMTRTYSQLPITITQLKTSNKSENLLNQIRKIIFSLYRTNEITEKVYNNIINSIKP